jgi:hypothetical protein
MFYYSLIFDATVTAWLLSDQLDEIKGISLLLYLLMVPHQAQIDRTTPRTLSSIAYR